MRLFWKDQFPVILVFVIQTLLVLSIYWLSGNRQPRIALYSLIVSIAVLAIYLTLRYIQQRRLYHRLTKPAGTLEEMLTGTGDSPMSEAFNELMKSQYTLYQNEIYTYTRKMDNHTAFMNRWVHQMKTPVSVLQLMLKDRDDELSDSMQDEVDRIQKGLEMVLYNSRLEEFSHDFHVEQVNLLQAVNGAIAENRRLFIRKAVYPDIQIDPSIQIYSDKKWLMFIIGQVLTNGVNYSAGISDKISLSAYERGRFQVLEITDYGIGIAKEDLPRVFEPYYTGQRGRQYSESTGMGLYLVQEICSQLGHRVELESEPGAGTTLRLIFEPEHNLT
ncbi:sensor histidine kinase [Paenibacillus sp. J22TS3]|uniref:sensor histidine kinase n=1 Tax=Paenibacillus sp. J22TS3 TaxID=2807192 RepID=UPI001B1AFA02|nr:sensor histidine kinase [Paenibacillus sp. J22TS3]GIP23942.1 sensor histidine kinase [Paenibacillus sp. J22TS3]